MLILGIDDAGRGPLIGPMMLAGVLIEERDERILKEEGVADSKKLTHLVRMKLADIIKDSAKGWHVVSTSADQIDHALNNGINLNTLEAMKTAEIINKLNSGKEKIKVIVDCPSTNTRAWKATLIGYISKAENLDIYCEHKADANYPSVSAASILAKVAREEAIEKLQKEYGDMGSGYPSDPYTIAFLKKHGKRLKDTGIFRTTWATWKQIFPDAKQKTLEGF
ncbi:ribonuclease HII [Candidatus Pacearchaeota archaeon]|nr:ribonuclease HII [Candidatus Pacearchaeota archaeon]